MVGPSALLSNSTGDIPKEGPMTGPIYQWQTTYDSAVLEIDLTQIPDRVTEALKAIDERLRSCIVYGSPEHIEIEGARKALAALKALALPSGFTLPSLPRSSRGGTKGR